MKDLTFPQIPIQFSPLFPKLFPSYSQLIPTKFLNKIVTLWLVTPKVPSFSHEIPKLFPFVYCSPSKSIPVHPDNCIKNCIILSYILNSVKKNQLSYHIPKTRHISKPQINPTEQRKNKSIPLLPKKYNFGKNSPFLPILYIAPDYN